MFSSIQEISVHLPSKINLKKIVNNNYKKIVSKTGFKEIHEAHKDVSALDLAIKSAKKLNFPIRNKIDAVIYVTQSPEYFLPTSACILQDRLSLKKNCLAFDVNQGCSGYIYGLSLADSLIKNNICNNVLLICSDTYRKYINNKKNSCFPIFSDAATSTVISKKSKHKTFKDFLFYTDGSGYKELIVKNSANNADKKKPEIYMNGSKILMFTMSVVPKLIKNMMKKNKIKVDTIDHFILHQASKVVLDNLQRKFEPQLKHQLNFNHPGNTVSSTIPITLRNLIKMKKLKKNQKILLAGFGVGYSFSAVIINW